jgi:hypothetical protein
LSGRRSVTPFVLTLFEAPPATGSGSVISANLFRRLRDEPGDFERPPALVHPDERQITRIGMPP